jgi:cytochrome c-type biogenesis protein CcmE
MTNTTLAKIAITVAVAVAGVGFFVKSTLGSAQHHKRVDELGTDLARWQGTSMKIYGRVVPGTLREEIVNQKTQRSFVIEHDSRRIRVFHFGPKPDVFKDLSEVAVTGHVVPAADMQAIAASLGVTADGEAGYVVDATDLQAKCPTRYTGAMVNRDLSKEFK